MPETPSLEARGQRQRFGIKGCKSPPTCVTGITRLHVAVQMRADDRVKAIGSNQQPGLGLLTIFKPSDHAPFALLNSDTPGAAMYPASVHQPGQYPEQVRPGQDNKGWDSESFLQFSKRRCPRTRPSQVRIFRAVNF